MDTPTHESTPATDLNALAWVHEELRRSLDAAHKALRRFVKESAAMAGSDVDAVDPGVLRSARAQIHQGVGALELVGLVSAATLLRASEAAVQRFVAKPAKLSSAVVDDIEKASFALLDYLSRLLAGKEVSALSLFPQYKAVQETAGAERIHPADLWQTDWQWQELPADPTATPRAANAETQSALEQQMLAMMRGAGPRAFGRMSDIFAGLAAGAPDRQTASMWQMAAAVFEAQAKDLLTPDVFSKRLASRLLSQLRIVSGAADHEVSERLAHDILFFCAQARSPGAGAEAPRLAAVRQRWHLAHHQPVDYTDSHLGRFDPALVVQARKRVTSAKDSWSAVAGGEMHRMSGLLEQFSLVGDSLKRLFASGDVLANELQQAMAATQQSSAAPTTSLAMEVATALLYVEASLEEGEFDTPQQVERIQRLAQRLTQVRSGDAPPPLEPWIEELYRRVSDRQTMGSVVQELRSSLAEVEKTIDQFFRDPSHPEVLVPAPNQLSSMRGVLSVLGMDQAAAALLRMRDEVDALAAATEPPASHSVFDRLAGNLGTLGFLIDMLSVQPHLAKSLFRYDAEAGTLEPVMGRSAEVSGARTAEAASAPSVEPRLVEQAQMLAFNAASESVPLSEVARDLERLSQEAHVADQAALTAVVSQAKTAFKQANDEQSLSSARGELSEALVDFVFTSSKPMGLDEALPKSVAAVPAPAAAPAAAAAAAVAPSTSDDDDAEVREIFLEEAKEVLASASQALADLRRAPSDLGPLASLRRAYHTLKGSSRMVGLTQFGDAAWEGEQVYNTLLASQGGAGEALLAFTEWSFQHLGAWVEDIEAGTDAGRDGSAMAAAVKALQAGQMPPQDALAEPSGNLGPEVEAKAEPVFAGLSPFESATALPLANEAAVENPELIDLIDVDSPTDASEVSLSSFGDLGVAEPFDSAAVPQQGQELRIDLDLESQGPSSPTAEPSKAIDFGEPQPWSHTDHPLMLEAFEHVPTEPASLIDAEMDLPPMSGEERKLIELDLSFDGSGVPAAFPDATQEVAMPEASASEPSSFDGEPNAPLEAPEMSEATDFIAGSEVDADLSDLPSGEPLAAPAENDQFKMVGSLRIGIPLFNIYLNEADELSRRLTTELAEWSLELHRPVGETAVALAHSLAGSSATVGFTELSQMARSLEHALMRSQAIGQGTDEEGTLFCAVADEIRHLLHQFAAGFLKEPDPQLLQRLADHELSSARRLEAATAAREHSPVTSERSPLDAIENAHGDPSDLADPGDEASATVGRGTSTELAMTAPVPPDVPQFKSQLSELKTLGALPTSSTVRPAQTLPELSDGEDDDLDAVDAVDAELFPIFEEEALELLPQLSGEMRAWSEAPTDLKHGSACMRTLHTLKGGARLAGAMRLGELAHRLESRIEQVMASSEQCAADIQALENRADGLTRNFEALRHRDAQAYAAAVSSAEQVAALPLQDVSGFSPLDILTPEIEAEFATAGDESVPVDAAEGAAQPFEFQDEEVAAPAQFATGFVAEAVAPLQEIDWSRFGHQSAQARSSETTSSSQASVRVRAPLLDRLVNQAGEVSITRSRIESDVGQIKGSLVDLADNLERLRIQLRDIELQAETQMSSRLEAAKAADQSFDPLEFDRFTRFQELTRMMAESVNDVATVQRTLQRTVDSAEDELASQARLARGLQDDLLRTRMVEFEGMSDRLYRVVRQAAKETGKQVRLDIVGGSIEVDRGVLDRMMGSFEHLLRNSVTHGIELPEQRSAAGKDPTGTIVVSLTQEGNEVGVEFRDDGGGLHLDHIQAKGVALGLLQADQKPTQAEIANLIFTAGFSTAEQVTELAGRGVGMDVVRSEVNAMGGRIETATAAGQGTSFKLQVPLTTAVTQVVMLRSGNATVAVPSTLIELVRRATEAEVTDAYASGSYHFGERPIAFFWLGALLQLSAKSMESTGRMRQVVIVRSAQQRIAVHVDEVLGNQEVVVKNLGPQLARVPGLAGMTLLASGAVALIYNPVALATLYGEAARVATQTALRSTAPDVPMLTQAAPVENAAPLILVVDDSLTVRRVTQRLLVREGYRVTLAKDGLEALERLQDEKPDVVLSDIEMPRMDGFDLVRNIRGDTRLSDLPVIMITSRIAQKHREYAAELGVDHYLGKPYSEEDLLALIVSYTASQAAP